MIFLSFLYFFFRLIKKITQREFFLNSSLFNMVILPRDLDIHSAFSRALSLLDTVSRAAPILTAILCVALASCSFIDSIKGTVKELAKYIDEMVTLRAGRSHYGSVGNRAYVIAVNRAGKHRAERNVVKSGIGGVHNRDGDR